MFESRIAKPVLRTSIDVDVQALKPNNTLYDKDIRISIKLTLPPNTPFNRGGVLKQ
ncbi:MAG: hypothetical protein P0116_11270 [Candidatus Nitrosocosmicus sp.]|nr:hypothetical protein [Candidatus Nitrosocosmicus sp.]